MGKTILVVGGGAAGMSAASRAKRINKENKVIVVEKTRYISFALCGIPYYVSGIVKSLEDLLHYPPEEFTVKRGIQVLFNTEVVDIDPEDKKAVIIDKKNGEKRVLQWDKLVLATGAKPRLPSYLEGLEIPEGIFYVSHLEDAERIRSYAIRKKGGTAVVAGTGYLGLEMAEALTRIGLRVTLVGRREHVLYKSLDKDIAVHVTSHLEKNGVRIMSGNPVVGIERKGDALRVELESGESINADLAVLATGVKPNTDLAEKMGLRIGSSGAVWVDGYLRTSIPDIYSAGDNTETVNVIAGERTWFPFATVANKMGFIAGTNVGLGKDKAVFQGVVGTSTLKVFDMVIASTGLTERDARKKGFEPVAVSVEARNKPHYMPGVRELVLKIVADKKTGLLLGAQGLGDDSVFWRVNIIASLIMKKATIWDLFYTDLGYAPPLAPAWDPIVIAGRLLMREFGIEPKL